MKRKEHMTTPTKLSCVGSEWSVIWLEHGVLLKRSVREGARKRGDD